MTTETTNLIPAGVYRARATDAQLGQTNSGSEQVAIAFQVLTLGFENQRLAYYGQFGEKSLEITVKALRACGWQGLDLADLSGVSANEVNLVVEHETYEGKTRARVKWVNDGQAGLMKNVLDAGAAKSFAQRMRGAIANLEAGKPKAAPAQRAATFDSRQPPPHGDADAIPF